MVDSTLIIFIVASIIVIYEIRKDPELVKPAPQTGIISGKLVYGGQPVIGAEVKLVQDGFTVATVTSDSEGNYAMPVMAIGEYDVAAHLSNADGTWFEGHQLILLEAETMVVDLAMECSFVSHKSIKVNHENQSNRYQVQGI